jgi:glutamate racemase
MIGIFDSGFGGLAVFREIAKALPEFDYIYLGDNARAPYGHLSQDIIYDYTKQAIDYLFAKNCDLIILACNTVSAEALRKLQQEYLPAKYPGKNVLGIIRPLVEVAASKTSNKKIAILGTRSTIESNSYPKELQEQNPDIQVVQQACPLLAPLVEESQEDTAAAKIILENYLQPLKNQDFDTLILGCTHYSFFHDQIAAFFGQHVKIIENGSIIAAKLADYIKRHPEFAQPTEIEPQRIFLTTDDNQKFDLAAKKFLGREIKSQKINLIT